MVLNVLLKQPTIIATENHLHFAIGCHIAYKRFTKHLHFFHVGIY